MRARVVVLLVVGLAVGLGLYFFRAGDRADQTEEPVIIQAAQTTPKVEGASTVQGSAAVARPDAQPASVPPPAPSPPPTFLEPINPAVPPQAVPRTAPSSVPPTTAPMPVAPVVSSPPAAAPSAPAAGAFSQEDILRDLDKVTLSLRDYRTIMKENPTGTNAEIVKALNGGNPKQARLLQEGLNLNQNGELIDRWGTPYFFHQLSKDQMEIRSAGPDRQMWTDDDTRAN